jgi:acyl-CoA dehydrogenase-like protein
MDVRLSPEQRALRDAAAQVVDKLGPQAVGQLADAERTAKLDAAVAASGWRELRTAADADGAPLASGVEVGVVAEELGRGLADAAFTGPTLAAELRRRAGAPPAPGVETVVVTADLADLAIATDVDGALPPGAMAIDAQGAVTALVLLAGPADGLADTGATLGQVDVPPAEARVDLTRPVATLRPSWKVHPLPDQGRALTGDDRTHVAALGLATACADLVGTMRGAVRLATGYAGQRRQYDRPVGSFQAVQHLLADAHVAAEGSSSVALHAAWAADALPPDDALAAASLAKAYCARAARSVCETAIQVHGGIGNTWECLAHVHLRRALLSSDLFGGVGTSLTRILAHHGVTHGTGAG